VNRFVDASGERIERSLKDFLAFAGSAERLVARGRQRYDEDEMLPLAAEAILHKIGEVIARLPDEFTASHPSVRWRVMKGTRNVIAHQYEIVDPGLVWSALEKSLPIEVVEIRRILDEVE
jgi:uncharacterized protein with HEPN domain